MYFLRYNIYKSGCIIVMIRMFVLSGIQSNNSLIFDIIDILQNGEFLVKNEFFRF